MKLATQVDYVLCKYNLLVNICDSNTNYSISLQLQEEFPCEKSIVLKQHNAPWFLMVMLYAHGLSNKIICLLVDKKSHGFQKLLEKVEKCLRHGVILITFTTLYKAIDCRETLAIHSYLQLHDQLRCNFKQAHDIRPIHLNLPTNVIL